jgi:hypothetical protein
MTHRLFKTFLLLAPLSTGTLLAISYIRPLNMQRGGFDRLPLTGIVLEKGACRIDRVTPAPGVTKDKRASRFLSNNTGWMHCEAPGALVLAEYVLLFQQKINLSQMQVRCLNPYVSGAYYDLDVSGHLRPKRRIEIGPVAFDAYIGPLWPFPAALSLGPLFLLGFAIRGRLRSANNCCLSCGYDLTGNISGVCPECGEKIA